MRHQYKISILFVSLFFCFLLLLLWSFGDVSATKYTVDDDGPADHSKIQDAVDAADHGDIVQVAEGIYYENIDVNKRLTITGNGTDTTTINGGGKGDVVTISGDGTSFSGFKVINSGSDAGDAAISIQANNSRVFQNVCEQSTIGICVTSGGNPSIKEGNEIFENNCNGNVLGISLTFSRDATIEWNNCSANTVPDSNRGIHLQSSDNLTVENNFCEGNEWNGIYLESVEYSDITNNTCQDNGDGITVKGNGMNTLALNRLSANDNGILLLTTQGNTLLENVISENGNRGIFLRGASYNTITSNVITMNPSGIVLNAYLETNSEENSINTNDIHDNENFGMDATGNSEVTIDAKHNFWGHASGPYIDSVNPGGKGDEVTEFVDFDPWTHVPEGYERVTAQIDSITPEKARVGHEIIFTGSILEERTMESYVWSSSLDGELSNGTDTRAGTVTQITRDNLSAGTHVITFFGIDFRGIPSTEATQTIVVHTNPVAEILSITPSPALHVDEITFLGKGLDDGTITQYSWWSSLDGILYNGTESSFPMAPTSISNGTHIIFLMVQDDNGIWGDEVNITLIVNGKPSAIINSILPNPAKVGTDIIFTGSGTDDGTIVLYNWTSSIDGPIHTGPNASFTTDSLSLGEHTITLRVQDDLGAYSNPITLALSVRTEIVGNTVPQVEIIGPGQDEDVSEKFKVKGTASDEDGTVTKVELSVDGGNWKLAQGTDSWSLVLDAGDLTLGNHTIRVRSYDGTDYSEEKVVTIRVVEAEENGDKGFLPGFGSLFALYGVGIAALMSYLASSHRSRIEARKR